MKVVVDTNTVLSGIARQGSTPAQILTLWRQGAIELFSSTATIVELERVLFYPKIRKLIQLTDTQIQQFITLYRGQTTWVDVTVTLVQLGGNNHIILR